MQKHAASRFIDDNFDPEDRLAIVLIDRRSGAVTQRLASACSGLTSPARGTICSQLRACSFCRSLFLRSL